MEKNSPNQEKFDVVIIGGGAAGLSAALWCDELGLSALLLERSDELGGQLLWTYNAIKNHLGTEAENGRELRDIFLRQIGKREFQLCLGAQVSAIDFEKKQVSMADGSVFSARAVIIATGVSRRKLNVVGEDEFRGRGLIESGKQNAEQVKDKRVLIVGGGDAAFENALILAEKAARVTLVHRRSQFTARAEFVRQVTENPKVDVLTETVVQRISGNTQIESVELRDLKTGKTQNLPVETLLIRIGVAPNTQVLQGKIRLDKAGYIEINQNCETNLAGIWAVGDVANPLAPTVSSATGMGATAVKSIYAWLNS